MSNASTENKNIVYIDIKNIQPHPKNPRKQFSDIEELAESIKENGIMQNLTVVPWYSQITGKPGDNGSTDGDYYAVIGNRRLAAAQIAGLTQVPCIISEMDEKQQVATMLMENMQRSDLTVIEEAEGMQMMFDLGSTAEEIAEKTGLSKTTIKRRTQLLELDRGQLAKSLERGGRMQDYLELQKIKDAEKRNKVLEQIGTNNFNYAVKRAVDEEQEEQNKKAIIEMVEEFAQKIDDSDYATMRFKTSYRYTESERQKPEDAGTKKYYYVVRPYQIELYVDREKNTEEEQKIIDERIKNEKRWETKKQIEKICESMYELRYDFAEKLPPNTAKKHIHEIVKATVEAEAKGYGWAGDGEKLLLFFGMSELDKNYKDGTIDKLDEKLNEMPEKMLFAAAYTRADSKRQTYANFENKYRSNNELDFIYELLGALGYEMSDEEIAMKNGTHELYAQEEEERNE